MKKTLSILAVCLVFALTISGCSEKAPKEPVYGPTEGLTIAVLILPRTDLVSGWQLSEFNEIFNGFTDKTDAEVLVVAPVAGIQEVYGAETAGIPVSLLYDYSPEDIDVIVVIGGNGPFFWQKDADLQKWLQDFAATGRPVAGVCSGVTILACADILTGKKATTSPTYEQLLVEHGATYTGEGVQNDGQFWTFRMGEESRFIEEFLPVFAGVEE